jgi:hypothetical protein
MEKLTSGSSHIGTGSTSATVSTEYTYSVYVGIPSSNSVNMAGSSPYFRPQPANASVGSLTYEGSSAWGTWPRDQWVRVSITATTQATNVTSAYISCYLNTAGDKIYFTAPQFEQKGHATQFVNGTRSTTQGLLDLTKNETITLSNMSYDSNAQMSFDGTDDQFLISNPGVGTSFSIEVVIKVDNYSNGPIFISPNSVGIDHFFRVNSNGAIRANFVEIADSSNDGYTSTTLINTGEYYHVVISKTPSNGTIYVNGVAEDSHTPTLAAAAWSGDWRIGARWNNTYNLNGELPILKVYDRDLAPAEVLQNYNALKSRFA